MRFGDRNHTGGRRRGGLVSGVDTCDLQMEGVSEETGLRCREEGDEDKKEIWAQGGDYWVNGP